jgi:hypothetical protein
MTGIWLISYVMLWLLVLGGGAVLLMLARENEALHMRLDAIERRRSMPESERPPQPRGQVALPGSER